MDVNIDKMMERPLIPLLMIPCVIRKRLNANETMIEPMMIPADFKNDASKKTVCVENII